MSQKLFSFQSTLAALFICLFLPAYSFAADQIRVAAASDLSYAMKDVAARYEKKTGSSVQLSFGASGNFFAQIQNGAPFDVFFSADVDYPKQLESRNLTVPGTIYSYATGHLVLWSRSDKKLDVQKGISLLSDAAVNKIAIANPEHAPYGRAAVSAMQKAGVYDSVKSKLVLGENISQAAQFAQTGNADVGLIALSLALAPEMKSSGIYADLPTNLYPPIEQAAVIMKSSSNPAAAKGFLEFIKSPEIRDLLKSYGFQLPAK